MKLQIVNGVVMLLSLFIATPVNAATGTQCDICEALMSEIDEQCRVSMCSTEEQFWYVLDRTVAAFPTVLRPQAQQMAENYGQIFAELYTSGTSPADICIVMGLCDDGGGGDPCPSCSNCQSTSWTSLTADYEKRTVATCNCGVCNTSTQYRCGEGYYGSSTNGTSGCNQCPMDGNTYGLSAAGSTAKTSCYILSGESLSDSTGTFTYTSDCYYTN